MEQLTIANNYTHAELTERMKSPGWTLVAAESGEPVTGSLEDILKITHGRQKSGYAPGLIEEIETPLSSTCFK